MSESKKRRTPPAPVGSPPGSPKTGTAKPEQKPVKSDKIHSPEPRAPPALTAAPSQQQSDYERLRAYVDEQLVLAKERIDANREDHQKLKDVVEDRFNGHQQLRNEVNDIKDALKKQSLDNATFVTHAGVHEASDKILEECGKLLKTVQDPLNDFGEQIKTAISQTNGLQLSMDTFMSGAFNIVEENLKILEKEILDFKNSYAPKSSLKQLEELVSALGRTAPPTDGLPSAGDAQRAC